MATKSVKNLKFPNRLGGYTWSMSRTVDGETYCMDVVFSGAVFAYGHANCGALLRQSRQRLRDLIAKAQNTPVGQL